ncbi:MAG: hypothetical protein U5L76_01125 [Patescibacteria group bacterium]|nr:hypothetical protein [Patescibacteria group bacterium]
MSKAKAEVDQLLIYDPDKSRSTTHIFLSRPTPLEEKNLGRLFVICEIDSEEKINQEIINIIQQELKNHFYYSEETNVEAAFENALSKTNQALHHIISEGITNWLDKFNIIIAVIHGTRIYLAHIGRIHAFLIHRDKIIDIITKTSQPRAKINPLKIFSNIIEGNVNPGDQLLFCTTSLLDYFSQEKLKRVISNTLPSDSTKELEKILLEANAATSFGAIVSKLVPTPEKLPEQKDISRRPSDTALSSSYTPPQASMQDLRSQEEKTSEYLSPSVFPKFFKSIKKSFSVLGSIYRKKVLKKGPKRSLPDSSYYSPEKKIKKPKPGKNYLKNIFNYLSKGIKWLAQGLASLFWALFNLFRKPKTIKNKLKEIPEKTESKIHSGIFRFRRLPKKAQKTLIIALIILFIFATSIVYLGWQNDNKLSAEREAEIIRQIQDLTFEAGAALSYEDERGAKELLGQARDLLAQLPNKSKEEKATYSELETGIEKEYQKTLHVVNVDNPILKKDFSELENYSPVSSLVQAGDFAYLINANNNIYEIDLTRNEVITIENNLTDIGQFQKMVQETTSTVLLYDNNPGMVELNKNTGVLTPLTIDFPQENMNVQDLAVYRSRFYYLDSQSNQIYRHQRGTVGFGPSTAWIRDPDLNIQDGVSLVIDGSIYLLKSNGQLLELFQGYEQDFSLDIIDPALSSAEKVWTSEDSNYIYILDNQNKRLVQFDKQGNLVNQYFSDQFNDLKDFSVDEDNSKAFLLASSKLFEITINL